MSRSPSLLLLSAAAAETRSSGSAVNALLGHQLRAFRRSEPLVLLSRPSAPPLCPHCGTSRIHRWGRFGLRQRYRCRSCTRTFSDFTGTALYRLRRADRFPAFCRCMVDGLSVRRAAARVGIHKDTAFRWRHRLLAELRRSEDYPLGPVVSVGESFVYWKWWLVLGLDDRGRAAGSALGAGRRIDRESVTSLLSSRTEAGALVLSTAGGAGPVARFARSHGLSWLQRRPVDPRFDGVSEPIRIYAFRFRRWLIRFYGVAPHYLDNYLAWFRLVDGSLWNGTCRAPG